MAFLSCATYYDRSQSYQEAILREDFERADAILDSSKGIYTEKNRLLFLMQKGTVNHLLGRFEESNRFFEEAYTSAETMRTQYAAEAAALLTNPQVVPYRGEDFEVVQINYYKALNFLLADDLEAALVECRRLNIVLNRLNDRYKTRKNRYTVDAFALLIMGMVFDAAGEYNDAFIAYRNSYEAYTATYAKYFGIQPPEQLKNDLMRTAYLNGFSDELERYQRLFGRVYTHRRTTGGTVVVFWHTGLGPVKDEWSINFLIVRGEGGAVFFVNDALGLTFPFVTGEGNGTLGDLRFLRVAFPRYRERRPYFQSAELIHDLGTTRLEPAQNINAVAYATLEDRMHRELGTSLLRLALKQASQRLVREVDENLAALLSITNSVTERADTRNWQTLPYAIHYARVELPAGGTIKLRQLSPRSNESEIAALDVQIVNGETRFFALHQLASFPLGQ
jgi:hypothetical protein